MYYPVRDNNYSDIGTPTVDGCHICHSEAGVWQTATSPGTFLLYEM